MRIRLPKTRRFRFYIYFACTLLILFAVDLIWVALGKHITVAPDTTYITSPLKPDGLPDYLAAIDERDHEGVTPENNAANPLLSILGPKGIPQEYREAFCKAIGAPVPPEEGPYMVAYWDYLQLSHRTDEDADKASDFQDFVRSHVWVVDEAKDVNAWLELEGNKRALGLVDDVLAKVHFFEPVNLPGSPLEMGYSHLQPQSRGLADLLACRAMLECGNGNFVAARADLMRIHHLARLLQSKNSFGLSISYYLDYMASRADAAFASAKGVSSSELRQFSADLDALAPMPSVSDCVESERLAALGATVYGLRHPAELDALYYQGEGKEPLMEWLINRIPANYNDLLRLENRQYDKLAVALSAPTFTEQLRQSEELNHWYEDAPTWRYLPIKNSAMYLSPVSVPVGTFAKSSAAARMARIAFALSLYARDKGSYPETLAQISPDYLTKIPNDPFADQPLHYRKINGGYLLYSVGRNLKDDGGLEHGEGHDADDIAIHVPPKMKP